MKKEEEEEYSEIWIDKLMGGKTGELVKDARQRRHIAECNIHKVCLDT